MDMVRNYAFRNNRKERFRINNRLEFGEKLNTNPNIVTNDNVCEHFSVKEGVHNHVKEN